MIWKKCKRCRIKFKGNVCPNCSFKKMKTWKCPNCYRDKTTEDDIIAVESPSGILTSAYSVVETDVVFDADSIPETNSVVRIVHL